MKEMPNPNANSRQFKAEVTEELKNYLDALVKKKIEEVPSNPGSVATISKRTPTLTEEKSKKVIRKDVQSDVDEYIRIHAQYSELKRQLNTLRNNIEPYMYEQDITFIQGTESGRVVLQDSNRALTTAKYTTYAIYDLEEAISPDVLSDYVVRVIDRDMLELGIKAGRIPEEVKELRNTNLSTSFVVKK